MLAVFRKPLKNAEELKSISTFESRQKNEGAYDSRKLGVQTVALEQIRGSVGRYQDFDDQFRFKSDHHSERFTSILDAMRQGTPMPPVKLYQIKDEFYVVDGNHRVAAAKKLCHDEILASVIEFIPSNETLENVLYRELMDFCDRTGLPRTLKFTEPGQYKYLLLQITDHFEYLQHGGYGKINGEKQPFKKEEISFKKAARDWYKTIYLPFCAILHRGRLMETFPERTVSDLYVYISVGYWQRQRDAKYGIGLGKLIPGDMEAFRNKMADLKEVEYPEMKRGITAFVLMNVTGKQENKIIDKLFALDEVVEIHSVHGDVDFIIKVLLTRDLLSSDAEIISEFVHDKVRQLNGVISTKTLIPGMSKIKPMDLL